MNEHSTETFEWAIIEDGGVSDLFASEQEAKAVLHEYAADAIVCHYVNEQATR